MKSLFTGILASTVILSGLAISQDAAQPAPAESTQSSQQRATPTQAVPPGPAQANASPRIAPGSVIPVQLTKSIDVKKAKTGDEVDATVTQDMKTGNGEVVVAKDTKVIGHVTEAQARNKEQKESQIGITFDHAVLKKGGDVPLPMSIQAIISPTALGGGNSSGGGESAMPPHPEPNPATSQGNNGRSAGSGTPQSSMPSASAGESSSDNNANAHQPITGNTQGVVGFPDLKLSTASDTTRGSVVSSEKNNVKLDSGTLMLLRVNQ